MGLFANPLFTGCDGIIFMVTVFTSLFDLPLRQTRWLFIKDLCSFCFLVLWSQYCIINNLTTAVHVSYYRPILYTVMMISWYHNYIQMKPPQTSKTQHVVNMHFNLSRPIYPFTFLNFNFFPSFHHNKIEGN